MKKTNINTDLFILLTEIIFLIQRIVSIQCIFSENDILIYCIFSFMILDEL